MTGFPGGNKHDPSDGQNSQRGTNVPPKPTTRPMPTHVPKPNNGRK